MIKAVIFDCFGVLMTEGWLAFKDEYFSSDKELFNAATDIIKQADLGLITPQEAVKATADLAGISSQEFNDKVFTNQPNKQLFSYINELKKTYKIGMLSNVSGEWIKDLFTAEQIAVFDAMNFSYQSGVAKPNPQAYLAAANKLAVEPEECVFVDDLEGHLIGAREAGMQTVLYEDFEQTKSEIQKILADSKS